MSTKRTYLILDGNPARRRSAARSLRRQGHVVHEALSLQQATDIIGHFSPAGVIVDPAFPDARIGEFLDALKENPGITEIDVLGPKPASGVITGVEADDPPRLLTPADPIRLEDLIAAEKKNGD